MLLAFLKYTLTSKPDIKENITPAVNGASIAINFGDQVVSGDTRTIPCAVTRNGKRLKYAATINSKLPEDRQISIEPVKAMIRFRNIDAENSQLFDNMFRQPELKHLTIKSIHDLISDTLVSDKKFMRSTLEAMGIKDIEAFLDPDKIEVHFIHGHYDNSIYKVKLAAAGKIAQFAIAFSNYTLRTEKGMINGTRFIYKTHPYSIINEFENLVDMGAAIPGNVVKVYACTKTASKGLPSFGVFSMEFVDNKSAAYVAKSGSRPVEVCAGTSSPEPWSLRGENAVSFMKEFYKLYIKLFLKTGKYYDVSPSYGDLLYRPTVIKNASSQDRNPQPEADFDPASPIILMSGRYGDYGSEADLVHNLLNNRLGADPDKEIVIVLPVKESLKYFWDAMLGLFGAKEGPERATRWLEQYLKKYGKDNDKFTDIVRLFTERSRESIGPADQGEQQLNDFFRLPSAKPTDLIDQAEVEATARKFILETLKGYDPKIEIVKIGHYTFVVKCSYEVGAKDFTVALNISSPDPEAFKAARDDIAHLRSFGKDGLSKHTPRLIGAAKMDVSTTAGIKPVMVYATEWLDGYADIHATMAVNSNNLLLFPIDISDQAILASEIRRVHPEIPPDQAVMLSRVMSYEKLDTKTTHQLAEEIIKILTYYYDVDKETALSNVQINSGDFICKRLPDGNFDVRLTTVRSRKMGVSKEDFISSYLPMSLMALDNETSKLTGKGGETLSLMIALNAEAIKNGLKRGLAERYGAQRGSELFREFEAITNKSRAPGKPKEHQPDDDTKALKNTLAQDMFLKAGGYRSAEDMPLFNDTSINENTTLPTALLTENPFSDYLIRYNDLQLQGVSGSLSSADEIMYAEIFAKHILPKESVITNIEPLKAGMFYSVIRVEAEHNNNKIILAINISHNDPKAFQVISNDQKIMSNHYNSGRGGYIPSVVAFTKVSLNGDPKQPIGLFAVHWQEGYDELHISKAVSGNRFSRWVYRPLAYESIYKQKLEEGLSETKAFISAMTSQFAPLSPEDSDRVAREIVKILTYYYDPQTGTMLSNASISAGDFVYKKGPDGKISVKLITMRGEKSGVSRIEFLKYLLFGLVALDQESQFLEDNPKPGRISQLGDVIRFATPEIVMSGLKDGLIERLGRDEGLKEYSGFEKIYADILRGNAGRDNPPRIGKDAKVEVISQLPYDSALVSYARGIQELKLTRTNHINTSSFKATLETYKFSVPNHKKFALAIADELDKASPGFFTFDKLIGDLFGFASTDHKMIALHASLAKDIVAIFHEAGEYAILNGSLKLKLNKKSITATIDGASFRINLGAQAISVANKDKTNAHYLLRALQMELFGENDLDLTRKIRMTQDLRDAIIANGQSGYLNYTLIHYAIRLNRIKTIPQKIRDLAWKAMLRAASKINERDNRINLNWLCSNIKSYEHLNSLQPPKLVVANTLNTIINRINRLLSTDELRALYALEIDRFDALPRSILLPGVSYSDIARRSLAESTDKFAGLINAYPDGLNTRGKSPQAILADFIRYSAVDDTERLARAVLDAINRGPSGINFDEDFQSLFKTVANSFQTSHIGLLKNIDVFSEMYKNAYADYVRAIDEYDPITVDDLAGIASQMGEEDIHPDQFQFESIDQGISRPIETITYNPGPDMLREALSVISKDISHGTSKQLLSDSELNALRYLIKKTPREKGNTRDRRRQIHRFVLRMIELKIRPLGRNAGIFMSRSISWLDTDPLAKPDDIDVILDFILNYSNLSRDLQESFANSALPIIKSWSATPGVKKHFLNSGHFASLTKMIVKIMSEALISNSTILNDNEKADLKASIQAHPDAWTRGNLLSTMASYHSFQNKTGKEKTEEFIKQLIKATVKDGRFTDIPRYDAMDKAAREWFGAKLESKIANGARVEIQAPEKAKTPDGSKLYFEITCDPVAMINSGTEPFQTCQRCTEPTLHNNNGKPVNRAKNGQFFLARTIAVSQDGRETVLSRCHLEIAKGRSSSDKTDIDQHTLLVEAIYDTDKTLHKMIRDQILAWAAKDDLIKTVVFADQDLIPSGAKDEVTFNFIPVSGEIYRDTFTEDKFFYGVSMSKMNSLASAIDIPDNDPVVRPLDPESMVDDLVGSMISVCLSGKRLVLAFHKNVGGDASGKLTSLLSQLDSLRDKKGFDKLIKNMVIVRSYSSRDDLLRQLAEKGVDPSNSAHAAIFTFAPNSEDNMPIGSASRSILIDQKDFDPVQYYYPLIEIVTIALAKYVKDINPEQMIDYLKDMKIDPETLNIKDVGARDSAFMIITLVPKAQRYEAGRMADRYTLISMAIDSAA